MAFSLIVAAFMTGCNCNNPDSNTSVDNEVKDNAIETIMTRTSIRSFTDRAVSADTVEMLLRAGMAAPTAVNLQPWHFVVVNDRAKIDELGGNGRQSQMWHESPLVIVVCGNMEKAMEGVGQAFWVQDCSAATENILLAAHALGLGAVWTGCYPIEERVANISQVLGLPEHIVPLCAIVMGYPNESPQPKDKWKPENVSYNGFE
ncbi:MAG: nitroreductase family protein [Bacteroidales bacterium]|nr:nitroreductase family protein [Bacteroidales bacterium]